jgi:hypothetical protein
VAEGLCGTDGEGDAVGVPVGDGVLVADGDLGGVVREAGDVVRGAGRRVAGRGDAEGFGPGEAECCCVTGALLPGVTEDDSGLKCT